LAALETDNSTPYFLNLHNGEVAHTLILGMTGSGKSYFCNFLLQNAQKYAPLTFIFDVGGSFQSLTSIFGGSYLTVGHEARDDYVLFAGTTGLRPDEARRLEFRDIEIVDDEGLGETILEIEVRGKRGFGYCKSMPGAVSPFERLKSRLRPRRVEGVSAPTEVSDSSDVRGEEWRTPEPTDLIFPKWQSELFKTITEEENLRFDRDGRPRTAYSLRHTYISMRLMEGANIYQIAKNCRTSVGMIEKYYGVHVKNSLNAAAINVVSSGKDEMEEEFEYLMEEEE
jgi:integrase